MSGPHGRVALLLALALLVSGCTLGVGEPLAPTAGEATPTATNTTDATNASDGSDDGFETVRLANHPLSERLAANRTFRRVETLTGENVTRPQVDVITDRGAGGAVGSFRYTPYRFAEYLDLDNVSADEPRAAGLTDGFGNVYLVPSEGTRFQLEKVLAHEFVHVVQIRSGMLRQGRSGSGLRPANTTTDAAQVHLALVEGAAVYVTDVYVRRYLPGNVTLQSARIRADYEAASTGGRFLFARYRFGSRYVHARLDSPAQLRALYRDPPETTEQLLHNGSTGGPVYQPLSVTATGGDGWAVDDPDDVDIMGELVVRIGLRRAVARETAVEAATGWGNDRLVAFERGDDAGFAWVLRWDDARNATQFREAFRTYRRNRRTPADLAFRAEPVGDETVVVFSGPPAFVSRASASGTSERVRVEVDG